MKRKRRATSSLRVVLPSKRRRKQIRKQRGGKPRGYRPFGINCSIM